MKKTFKIVVVALALFSFSNVKAQEVKSQSEIIKTLNKGKYRIITSSSSLGYSGDMNIVDISADKNQPDKHFELAIEKFPDEEDEGDRRRETYFRDNLAFPATYIKNYYVGMKRIRQKVGYALNRGRDVGDDRLVVVGNYIFLIKDWNSKDEYWLYTILEDTSSEGEKKGKEKKKKKKKGFGGFFKALKEGIKAASSGGGDAKLKKLKEEVLQPYLDKAFEKQEKEYANWIKKPKNAKLKKHLDGLYKKIKQAERDYVKRYNDSLSKTPKYKRIDAHRARMANMKSDRVTIRNTIGRTIYVYEEGSRNTTAVYNNGRGTFSCEKVLYYTFSSKSATGNGVRITSGGKCGGDIHVK